jgi:NAD-dependent deacetylase
LHGNIWRARCAAGCGLTRTEPHEATGVAGDGETPAVPVCACGALMRPDIVWFGESLDDGVLAAVIEAATRCEVLLVIGTSSVVYPAAALPELAARHGATVIDLNVEDTPLTPAADVVVRGPAGQLLPAIEARL